MGNEVKRIQTKASFYFTQKLACHIKVKPMGFKDGYIISELQEDIFYWFQPIEGGNQERLFFVDIHDIKDYETRIDELKEGGYGGAKQ